MVAHDDGSHAVIGRLGAVAVTRGDRVHGGQPVGAAAGDRVYLEVRLPIGAGGLPVDPAPLLVAP